MNEGSNHEVIRLPVIQTILLEIYRRLLGVQLDKDFIANSAVTGSKPALEFESSLHANELAELKELLHGLDRRVGRLESPIKTLQPGGVPAVPEVMWKAAKAKADVRFWDTMLAKLEAMDAPLAQYEVLEVLQTALT